MITPAAREETIFHIARQLTHPQDRTDYLDDVCGDNKALRERIERLLQAEHPADEFFPPELKPKEPSRGDVLGDYEIIEKIGGNMGLVFKARHRLLDKVVALKLLPADSMVDAARLARFQREWRIMARLSHPNLVTAVDARIIDGWHIVAMEFIDGMDLQRVVETQGALPMAAACEVIRQAALGLQHAHENGLIHRDVKPSNLMVTRSGVIKVIDMGLALVREQSTGQMTESGMVLGTMRYCAPEQYRDASSVDTRADIYSLGCTLYHLLAGTPPYSHRMTLPEVMMSHLNEPFHRLEEVLPSTPAELGAILARMTAKDPDARFETPGEVAEALEPFARGADLGPLLPAAQENLGQRPAAVKVPATGEGRRTPVKVRRPGVRWLRRAAILVLLLAIVGAVIFALAPPKEDAPANVTAPVVVFMDTTAPKGIYDSDNEGTGRSNADELYNGLRGLDGILSPSTLHKEGIGLDWAREAFIIGLAPDLVIIHRSSFFHPLAASIALNYPPFANAEDHKKFQNIYAAQDDRLRSFISVVGSAVPQCQFLVYSRGTDTNWLSPTYRLTWTATLESSFTNLQGRIHTMVIPDQPDGQKGTFRETRTMEEMKRRVREMLKFPKRQDEDGK